jgi:hypothetical protein
MKTFFTIMFSVLMISASSQGHRLVKLWETDSIIAVPESVLPHKGNLYVSLIDGAGWDDDGKGGIGILSPNGKQYNGHWVTGLSAPKGMGILGNRMYVADINRVVVIDLKKGTVEKRIPLHGSQNLNDVTVGDGVVYVSDSKLGNIWQIQKDNPRLFLENAPGVNGVKFYNGALYYGEGRSFKKRDANGKISLIAKVTEPIDGIEPLANGDFILTSWIGYIYYVSKNGKVQTLLESHKQKINTADIGVDTKNNILYVPTFFTKKIMAYKII